MKQKKSKTKQSGLFDIQDYLSTAPCVPALRNAVASWREGNYKGITQTTRELLNFWFRTDHRLPNGKPFYYHSAQREAIETLIYVYEVEKVRSRKELLERYAYDSKNLRLPPYDDFSRYCIKMATGSGKTKVMALAIAWQYFNAVRENSEEYAKTFLIIAPNIIVFERLSIDFQNGMIFRTDPLFPKHYSLFWDVESYTRGDSERAHSEGAIYLTNIQQFYERTSKNNSNEPEILTTLLGEKPPTKKLEITDFDTRIINRKENVVVLNDEAHHTHDEENEWNSIIRKLHLDSNKKLISQLDFSATPRYSKGGLFAWTIFDYPLKQAIVDNIVKRPLKGISKIQESKSTTAHIRYTGFLTAGVERWKEYSEQLKNLNKKPILFVMMNSTEEADDVAEWLRKKYPNEFSGEKTLIIHTDRQGEVSKKDLDDARKLARNVDQEKSPVNVIVSVLMLREGWDVQNVTVVVGLRPYTAKANILPEQTIGRGLRMMFREITTDYKERVDIIGNNAFLSFVEDLEKIEGLKLDTFEVGKDKLQINTISPDKNKFPVDIGIPELSPLLTRKKSLADDIANLDVMNFKINTLPIISTEGPVKTFIYEGRDILSDEKLFEREYILPEAQTAQEIISYYARRIADNIKLPSQFAALAPKIKEFFEDKAFGKKVALDDPIIIKSIGSNVANYVVTKEFEKALREIVVQERIPELLSPNRFLSSTPPFPFSKLLIESKKSIFNYVACSNEYERNFAKFLNHANEVVAFAKIPEQFGFCIEYTDTIANLRNYYPDFVARLNNEEHWIIETKGREDIEVKQKDNAAINWCKNASELTDTQWKYLKVSQRVFEELNPETFSELLTVISH
jgi:type III restriction enzyme